MPEFQFPAWQMPLQDAIDETDLAKLPAMLEAAETAIFNRIQELGSSDEEREERKAIERAAGELRKIQARLGWPGVNFDEPGSKT